jgi:hypothetical protein
MIDYITKLCTKQVEVIENRENENVHNIEKGKAQHIKCKVAVMCMTAKCLNCHGSVIYY